jgi:hypothetical protein
MRPIHWIIAGVGVGPRYRESLEERVRDAVAHERELESKLPEPERKLSNRSNVRAMI